MSATQLLASHSRFSRFISQTSDSVAPSRAPPPSPSYRPSSHKTSFYLFTCKTPSLSLGPSGQRPGGSKSPGLTGCRPGPGWLPRKAEGPTRGSWPWGRGAATGVERGGAPEIWEPGEAELRPAGTAGFPRRSGQLRPSPTPGWDSEAGPLAFPRIQACRASAGGGCPTTCNCIIRNTC